MATTRVSTSLTTVYILLALQFIFTILAIAILSYKNYYLESELSSIRREISSGSSNGIRVPVQTPPPLTTAITSEQQKSLRIRRVSQRKPSETSSANDLQAECVQNMLKNLRVCMALLWCIFPKLNESQLSIFRHDEKEGEWKTEPLNSVPLSS